MILKCIRIGRLHLPPMGTSPCQIADGTSVDRLTETFWPLFCTGKAVVNLEGL